MSDDNIHSSLCLFHSFSMGKWIKLFIDFRACWIIDWFCIDADLEKYPYILKWHTFSFIDDTPTKSIKIQKMFVFHRFFTKIPLVNSFWIFSFWFICLLNMEKIPCGPISQKQKTITLMKNDIFSKKLQIWNNIFLVFPLLKNTWIHLMVCKNYPKKAMKIPLVFLQKLLTKSARKADNLPIPRPTIHIIEFFILCTASSRESFLHAFSHSNLIALFYRAIPFEVKFQ